MKIHKFMKIADQDDFRERSKNECLSMRRRVPWLPLSCL